MRAALALFLCSAAVCYTVDDVRKIQCDTACKLSGWDAGTWAHGKCWCMDAMDEGDLISTVLVQTPVSPAQAPQAGTRTRSATP
jgi:hypothetical protein